MKDGPAPGDKYISLDKNIMDTDRSAGVFPKRKNEIMKRLHGLGHLYDW